LEILNFLLIFTKTIKVIMFIEFLTLFVLAVLGVILHRYQKLIMPRSYFYYSRIIDGIDEGISYTGLLFRFLIPIIIGGTAAAISIKLEFNVNTSLYGGYCSLLVIFLLVWPDFLDPEKISPQFINIKWKLYGLYILLFSLYFTQGLYGAKSFATIYPQLSPLNEIIDWRAIINSLFASLIWLILGSGATLGYIKLFKK
jgi:hypothetical protein